MRKERFPIQHCRKLLPRGNGPFQVVERVNDNAYKLDLLGEYGFSAAFNVFDLSPFDVDNVSDLRTNPSQEEGNDNDMLAVQDLDQVPHDHQVQVPFGPITRAHAKKVKDSLQVLVCTIRESVGSPKVFDALSLEEYPCVNILQLVESIDALDG